MKMVEGGEGSKGRTEEDEVDSVECKRRLTGVYRLCSCKVDGRTDGRELLNKMDSDRMSVCEGAMCNIRI